MNKMIVAVFDSENKAHEGLTALKKLHENGDVSLYASAVIGKGADGRMQLKTAQEEGPVGMATGLVSGGLIGLLGGPVGAAVGAATGSFVGLLFDLGHDDVSVEFVDEVSKALSSGKTAVIAEVDEEWTIPVDAALEPLHAVVFRRYRYEVVDQQAEREAQAMADEFEALKKELKDAGAEGKARIEAALARLKKKAQTADEMLDKKLMHIQNELDAKAQAIEKQIKTANEKRKAKLRLRLVALKEEYAARTAKLKQASALVNEALSPEPVAVH
jgi:uncharacterized membrane protein